MNPIVVACLVFTPQATQESAIALPLPPQNDYWVGASRTGAPWEAPFDIYHCVLWQVNSDQLRISAGVGIKTASWVIADIRVFSLELVKYSLTYLWSWFTWLHHPSLLSLGHPMHRSLELPPDHHYVIGLFPMLLCPVPAGGVEVLLTCVSCILYQHLIFTRLPCNQAFPNTLSDCLVCGHISCTLQYHPTEYKEILCVPPDNPHTPEIVNEWPHKSPPSFFPGM